MNHHVEAVSGASVGLVSSLGLATGAVHVAEGVPAWAGYVVSLVLACVPVILGHVLRRFEKR